MQVNNSVVAAVVAAVTGLVIYFLKNLRKSAAKSDAKEMEKTNKQFDAVVFQANKQAAQQKETVLKEHADEVIALEARMKKDAPAKDDLEALARYSAKAGDKK